MYDLILTGTRDMQTYAKYCGQFARCERAFGVCTSCIMGTARISSIIDSVWRVQCADHLCNLRCVHW